MEVSISVLKKLLDEMVNEGLLEKFSHGGYTFYRITAEGKGYLLKEGSGGTE
jgi:predicted transcriptional regulator